LFALILFQGLVLVAIGHPTICTCGYVKLWHGVVNSSENSQHVTDWYTFSHIIHGFLFYYAVWLISRGRLPFALALLVAMILEITCEIIENTPFFIDRCRTETISLSYFGDSAINSMSDTLAAVFGFFLASRLPVWMTVVLAISMELFVGYFVHDNLTLNIIMLIHPFEAIKAWQAAI